MSWDTASLFVGLALEVALAALLTYKRAWRELPLFYAYIVWSLAEDCCMPLLGAHYGPRIYVKIYIGEMSLDSLLQYTVILELAASVLRPYRRSVPRWLLPAFAAAVILLGVAAWPFTASPLLAAYPIDEIYLIRLEQTFAILRVLFFFALAAGSHLFAIGWRDRELQVATGLGFYSLVSLAVAILHTHQTYSALFHPLDLLVAASYLCSLLYWLVCFARKPGPRRAINPSMERFLARLASTARSQRTALERRDPSSR